MSTRAQILAEIAAQFPDNNTGFITPAKLRQVVEDITNSYNNSTDEGTPSAAVAGLGLGPGPFAPLKRQLERGDSASMYIVGDSISYTKVSDGYLTRWPGQFVIKLAAQTPAYGIRLADWDNTNGRWGKLHTIYTPAGGVRAIEFSGLGNPVAPYRAPTGEIAGSFAVQQRWRLTTWAAVQWIGSRYSTDGGSDWQLRTAVDRKLSFVVLPAGFVYTTSEALPNFDGQDVWVGFMYNASTLAVDVYYSTAEAPDNNFTGWTKLGNTIAGNVSYPVATNTNRGWTIGATANRPIGKCYNFRAFTVSGSTFTPIFVDDIDGWGPWPLAAAHDPYNGQYAWRFSGPPSLTIWNASKGGQAFAWHTTNAAILFTDPRASIAIMAAFANSTNTGAALRDEAAATAAAMLAACPGIGFHLLTENPAETYAENALSQKGQDACRLLGRQCAEMIAFAAVSGWPVIDTYGAVLRLNKPWTVDGIHPSDPVAAIQGEAVLARYAAV